MRKTLTVAAAAIAITIAGCGKKPAPVTTPPPADQAGTATGDDVGLVELPESQADLVAKAGSDSVYFGTDEYALDTAARTTLTAQARWLLANPNVRASIEGHADERGTREYNLALGERRANSARDFLVTQGVPATRLTTISWGKERPAVPGSNETAWAQNRRAVTVIVR